MAKDYFFSHGCTGILVAWSGQLYDILLAQSQFLLAMGQRASASVEPCYKYFNFFHST